MEKKIDSYCSRIKSSLISVQNKNGCCRKTDSALVSAFSKPYDFSLAEMCAEKFKCDGCAHVFLRRCFISFGTVTEPSKSYHLELSFPDSSFRDLVFDIVLKCGIVPKRGTRRDRYTIYLKSSEAIADFLAVIGATEAVYDLINLKLVKEATIGINRQNNFEAANLKKTVKANVAYINDVNYLIESGNFDSLPPDLYETAKLRVENDTASMAELGRLHSPSITKSGVKHRLDRISEITELIKKKH